VSVIREESSPAEKLSSILSRWRSPRSFSDQPAGCQ